MKNAGRSLGRSGWVEFICLALLGWILWGVGPRARAGEPGAKARANGGQLAGADSAPKAQLDPVEGIFFQGDRTADPNGVENLPDAIKGEGFFEIQMPDGTLAYTRKAGFKLAADGRFITQDGYTVLSDMPPVPPMTLGFGVTARGETTFSSPTGTTIFQITLCRFANPAALEPIGTALFRETKASGPAETGIPGENGFGEIADEFLRLPGSFGFTMQSAPGNWVYIEASQDMKNWAVIAMGGMRRGGRLMIRDRLANQFGERFYRSFAKPIETPAANGQ